MSQKSQDKRFSWSQTIIGNILCVQLTGEIDLCVWTELHALLQQAAISAAVPEILLDMSGVTFIDAHSAGLIVKAEADARTHGRTLRAGNLQAEPAMVFEILGLDYLRSPHTSMDRSESRV